MCSSDLLETVVGWMATSTADLVGLGDRGRIAVGGQADLVAFDPEAPFTVDAAALAHKNPVSAFDGAALVGSVETVWQRGVSGGGLVGQLVARP